MLPYTHSYWPAFTKYVSCHMPVSPPRPYPTSLLNAFQAGRCGWSAARGDTSAVVEGVVLGTVIGEALFNALRRLAQQDASARLYGRGPAAGGEGAPDGR